MSRAQCILLFFFYNLKISFKVYVPEQFAVMIDFPRLNTRIQKYKIRELLKQKAIQTF